MRFRLTLLCATTVLVAIPLFASPALAAPNTADTTSDTTIDTERAPTNEAAASNAAQDGTYERAIVRDVTLSPDATQNGQQQKQDIKIEYRSGPLKGQTRTLSTEIDSNPYALDLHPGDRVVILLQSNPSGGEPLAYLQGYDRQVAIVWLIVLFVLTLVLLAGWQGLKVAASIMLSILLIGWILIPAFLKGINPVPVAMLLSIVLTTICSVFAMGWNKKSLVTIIGTFGGVVVAYLLSVAFGSWTHLQGLSTEEDRMFFTKNPTLNPAGLMFAGVIIAAMGVVEDVAVSIASGVVEVRRANPNINFKEMFRSGMIIGRDHTAALANTLIFAYVGASLSTLLLYTQYGGSWLKFLNFDVVTDEIVRSLAGTIGLVFTVPITAVLAAFICMKRPHVDIEPHDHATHLPL